MKREEVKHWLGNSYEDWIEDLMFRLLNNKVSVEEIKDEARLMYKDYLKDKLIIENKILESANEYFKDYQIDTFIRNNKLYVNMGTCELELSDAEIKYRAKCNDNKV